MVRLRRTNVAANEADQYLTTPNEMHHAIDRILDSELFNFHSERMLALLMKTCEQVSRTH
jgi:hypothetical protein